MSAECALLARELHEPLPGTAPEAVGWVCVEQPGAWGRDAALESGLPAAVAGPLSQRVDALDRVRLQLLRRPSDAPRPGTTRAVFLVHAGPRQHWVRRLEVADPRELLDLDLDVVTSPEAPDVGEPHDDPLFLVCTHAKRDACCALWGRPVAAALAARHPGWTWESSHVGGHRFAGNLVVLPHGLAYGFLQPEDAIRVVERHVDGFVDLDTLRGRSGLDRAAQAAEWFVRERSAARGLDDVALRPEHRGDERAVFLAEVADTSYRVEVARRPLGEPRLTGCDKDGPKDPGTWSLVSVDVR